MSSRDCTSFCFGVTAPTKELARDRTDRAGRTRDDDRLSALRHRRVLDATHGCQARLTSCSEESRRRDDEAEGWRHARD